MDWLSTLKKVSVPVAAAGALNLGLANVAGVDLLGQLVGSGGLLGTVVYGLVGIGGALLLWKEYGR